MKTEYSDHFWTTAITVMWWALAVAAVFVAVLLAVAWWRRRLDRREFVSLAWVDDGGAQLSAGSPADDSARVQTPAVALPDERTVAEIALDGLTDEQRADEARDARIALWEHDPDYFRRRDLATMDQYTQAIGEICDRLRRDLISAYEDGALAAEGFGFAIQRDRARMAALYERAHNADELREMGARPLAVTVDATETREWTPEEQAELHAMLDAGQAELDAERAEASA